MAHTKGPWSYHQSTSTDGSWVVYSDLGTVAFTTSSMRAEDNARLIASAPELLSTLQEIRKWMGVELSHWDARFIAQVDALIAKAEGGNSKGGAA